MKAITRFITLTITAILFSSCSLFEAQKIEHMNEALERHIKWQNEEEGMQSQIELVKVISYDEVNEGDTAYVAKVYLVAKSWYIGGSRVYNTNDTIKVYYADNMAVLKMQAIK